MAVVDMGWLLAMDEDGKEPSPLDHRRIAEQMERWFRQDPASTVRDAIIEELSDDRSEVTARILWAGLSDASADVRDNAFFYIEDILGEDAEDGGAARSWLWKQVREAAKGDSPHKALALELIEDWDG